jgi:DNA-binding Lrp family transcriptional regulator
MDTLSFFISFVEKLKNNWPWIKDHPLIFITTSSVIAIIFLMDRNRKTINILKESHKNSVDKLEKSIQDLQIKLPPIDIPEIDIYNLKDQLKYFARIEAGKYSNGHAISANLSKIYTKEWNSLDRTGSGWQLRWFILNTFKNLGDKQSIEFITEHGLKSNSQILQAYSANLVGQLSDSINLDINSGFEVVSQLENLKNSVDSSVKNESIWALNRINKTPINFKGFSDKSFFAYTFVKSKIQLYQSSSSKPKLRTEDFKGLNFNRSGIVECAQIIGNYDFIIKICAENLSSLTEILMRGIQKDVLVGSTRTFIEVDEPFRYRWYRKRSDNEKKKPEGICYVLIRAEAPTSTDAIVTCLLDIKDVTDATAVYGEVDVIAKIEGSELQRNKAITKIREIPFIQTTESYLVVKRDEENLDFWPNEDKTLKEIKGEIEQ